MTNLETLAAWTQNMTSVLAVTLFVTSLFYVINDFSDELNFDSNKDLDSNYKSQRRWALSLKAFSSAYIVFSMAL